ncbi:methyltransferase [Pseudarthrobacter phenanthrenivorans]|jgi:regulator of RNase E activity RraA|uniref:Putative 4-hydroxy-4-methyl-2-oxoglutarate aldolase n=1 Tax=Pseudarthrobacter phenanthrenivorans TaxID=361575 RepID=A0A0B4DAX2_PSEPS|nr:MULTISPECIES: methyltransferase [Micrococcaceae]KIC65877.1 methyltransferase [Pseudarthrobacter phenanthrenivorans]MDJ0459463.1 methyltransferase [Arthrobacter sp. NQ7]
MTTPAIDTSADFDRPDPAIVDRLANLPAANIGDAMDRLGVADSAIQAVWPGAKLAGPAFPVWTRPGDNKGIHAALQLARPGDVIVVAGGADESRALLGELIGERAINLGVAGFALDGAARDAEALGEIGMPVFARATSPAGPYKDGPFRLGTAVAFGGVPVLPGDIIIGDSDGVVVIPREQAAAVAEAAEAVFADETSRRQAIVAARS